jgi:phenazine biosynthesis protein phzE
MFAPTVTGSPMENACTVITRHETRPRGYYSGFLALFEPGSAGYSLDAPILIRTAYLHDGGRVSVPAGATLVRHSVPEHEVAETRAKAAGVLASLGLVPRGASPDVAVDLNAQPGVAEALTARNGQLAEFWVRPQDAAHAASPAEASPLTGRDVLIVDHEDQFTTMLAHQLRHLGMNTRMVRWDAVDDVLADDLLVLGPGPGDPRDHEDPRIASIARRIHERLAAGRPLLAVCLSHQVLAGLAGFPIRALPAPRQGVRLDADVFGTTAAIGYYNTFGAHLTTTVAAAADNPAARLALEPSVDTDGVLTALRGPGVASVQGHLESVLSADGLTVLDTLTRHVLGVPAEPAADTVTSPVR